MRPKPIALAIEKAGSVKALASMIGITPQSVSQWERVPIEHVRAIAALTGLSKHEIRGDVYEPADAQPQAGKAA